jgi:hypothetical protein
VQVVITLKHLAAALLDTLDLPKKQVEPVLDDLVTLGLAAGSLCLPRSRLNRAIGSTRSYHFLWFCTTEEE